MEIYFFPVEINRAEDFTIDLPFARNKKKRKKRGRKNFISLFTINIYIYIYLSRATKNFTLTNGLLVIYRLVSMFTWIQFSTMDSIHIFLKITIHHSHSHFERLYFSVTFERVYGLTTSSRYISTPIIKFPRNIKIINPYNSIGNSCTDFGKGKREINSHFCNSLNTNMLCANIGDGWYTVSIVKHTGGKQKLR